MTHDPKLVYFVTDEGEVSTKKPRSGKAQPTNCLVLNRPKGTKYVLRYYPRYETYRVFDARRFIPAPTVGQFYRAPAESFRSEDLEVALAWATISM